MQTKKRIWYDHITKHCITHDNEKVVNRLTFELDISNLTNMAELYVF